MFSQEIFRARLLALRTDRNLTQQELAEMFSVTNSTISNLESGRRSPSVELMVALADYFGVSLDYLTGRILVTQGDAEFAARLRLLRERQGKTQEQMAQVLGINVHNYRRYEAGGEPTIPHLVRLADCLCTTTDFLLGRANEG